MKFQLTIAPDSDESVHVILKKKNDLAIEIEKLCLEYNGTDKIPVYQADEVKILAFDEISYLTVIDNKIYAIDTLGKQYLVKMRLYEIEQLLPSYFIKINKSGIIFWCCGCCIQVWPHRLRFSQMF